MSAASTGGKLGRGNRLARAQGEGLWTEWKRQLVVRLGCHQGALQCVGDGRGRSADIALKRARIYRKTVEVSVRPFIPSFNKSCLQRASDDVARVSRRRNSVSSCSSGLYCTSSIVISSLRHRPAKEQSRRSWTLSEVHL